MPREIVSKKNKPAKDQKSKPVMPSYFGRVDNSENRKIGILVIGILVIDRLETVFKPLRIFKSLDDSPIIEYHGDGKYDIIEPFKTNIHKYFSDLYTISNNRNSSEDNIKCMEFSRILEVLGLTIMVKALVVSNKSIQRIMERSILNSLSEGTVKFPTNFTMLDINHKTTRDLPEKIFNRYYFEFNVKFHGDKYVTLYKYVPSRNNGEQIPHNLINNLMKIYVDKILLLAEGNSNFSTNQVEFNDGEYSIMVNMVCYHTATYQSVIDRLLSDDFVYLK